MVGVKNKSEYLLTKGPVQLCLPSIRTNRDITGARHGHYTTERRNLDFPDLPCNSKHWIAWDEDGGSESEWGVWQWVLSLSWLQDHGCHLRRESQWGTGPGTHGLAARTPWEHHFVTACWRCPLWAHTWSSSFSKNPLKVCGHFLISCPAGSCHSPKFIMRWK